MTWESGAKGLIPANLRRAAELCVFLIAFVIPTPVALILFVNGMSSRNFGPLSVVMVVFESLVSALLAFTFILSLTRRG